MLLASFPRLVSKFKIYAFSLGPVKAAFEDLVGELVRFVPSGIAENMDWKLSTRVSLNLSVSFFKADNLISNFVAYSFCLFMSYLNYSSCFSREDITAFSLACSSFAFAKSPCKIYTIFWFLAFSFTYLFKSFFSWEISPSKSATFFSSCSLVYKC